MPLAANTGYRVHDDYGITVGLLAFRQRILSIIFLVTPGPERFPLFGVYEGDTAAAAAAAAAVAAAAAAAAGGGGGGIVRVGRPLLLGERWVSMEAAAASVVICGVLGVVLGMRVTRGDGGALPKKHKRRCQHQE